jgi:murein DD-endopeptidase MepM/ murein hydrolase activator NlpD
MLKNSASLRIRAGMALGVSLTALSACTQIGNLDWDLRGGPGNTSAEALQSTAAAPKADGNGIISYPDYQLATARRGETVAALASRVGVNPEELARNNALRAGDPLREGELLLLPARVAAAPQPSTIVAPTGAIDVTSIATTALDKVEPAGTAPVATAAAAVPNEPLRHKVARGETAFTIARTYNISARALADWNSLGPDLAVREGQTLIIPVVTAAAPDPEPVPTPPGAGSPTPTPPSAAKPLPDEATEAAGTKAKDTPASPDLGAERTEASASKFLVPVQGKIIRGYTKKKNEGIDIAAAAGTPVVAAADGSVAAITKDTDQVPIVVIRHADNILTVYAGLDAVKVKKGDKVKRGQAIAAVGAGDPAFLHFEVRRGVDSLDPTTFLQ